MSMGFYEAAPVEGGAPRSESKYKWLLVATIPLFNQRMKRLFPRVRNALAAGLACLEMIPLL